MGLREHEPTHRVPDRPRHRRADGAELPDRRRARPGAWRRTATCIPGRAHIAAGSIAMQRARQRMAEILRILPGSSLVVAPSDTDLAAPEIGGGARGIVRRRRVHGAAARGAAAARRRPRRLGPGRPRVGLRAARQRRHPRLARAAAPRLRPLQRARQRRAARAQPRHAGDRPGEPARHADAAAPTRHAADRPSALMELKKGRPSMRVALIVLLLLAASPARPPPPPRAR